MLNDVRVRPGLQRPRRANSFAEVGLFDSPEALFRPPSWTWARSGRVGWWVRAEWRDALIGGDGLRLEEWKRENRLATVKTGPHRVVYRADLPEGSIFIKHFLVPGVREMLRQWFRRGKGRNEAKRAARLARIGIPTITPIALGEQRHSVFLFENYLITSAIPDTVPLEEFVERRLPAMPPNERARIERVLAQSLGALTARLHDSGLIHQDFHPGNILVRLNSTGGLSLAMIDLDALRVRPNLSWKQAEANLALLNHYFWSRCGRSDRHRFLRAYLEARRVDGGLDRAGFARRIEDATRAWAERLWRRWGRRCRATNKYFKKYKGNHCRAVAAREVDKATVRALLADPDAPFNRADAKLLKDSRTTTVSELTLSVGGAPTRVIYKRFNRKKWLDPIYTLFRPSRAWRAWQNGQHLASRAVPTPRNLVVIHQSAPGLRWLPHQFWPHDTYLVTAKAEPSITVYDYANNVLPSLDAAARRASVRRLVPPLARLIRVLHDRSLSHRDLKSTNILIEGDPEHDGARLSLIDLVGVHLEHPLSRRRQVQNLARLQLSLAFVPGRTRTDGLRFLRAYLPWASTRRDAWKALWREVDLACHRKEARNRKSGRKLS